VSGPPQKLPPGQEKYCDCVLSVAAKQPTDCLTDKAWYEKRDGKTCYNPYAVCAKSTKNSTHECGTYYDYDKLSDEKLLTLAYLDNIRVPVPMERNKLIQNIKSNNKV
jgi:hypothetical protein